MGRRGSFSVGDSELKVLRETLQYVADRPPVGFESQQCMYRIVVRMLRCPANSLMAITVAPRIAKWALGIMPQHVLVPGGLEPCPPLSLRVAGKIVQRPQPPVEAYFLESLTMN